MPRYILGIDVGATKISTGLVSMAGGVFTQRKFSTDVRRGTAGIIARMITAVETYPRTAFRSIGIGIMGAVDWRTGVSHRADKLPRAWRDIPLGQQLARRFGTPTTVDNDANAFSLGAAIREARRFHTIVGITLGSGIGGGIVIGKKLFHGRSNWVGEFGHTIIDLNSSLRCTCGERGHLETVAGGWGIERLYRSMSGQRADAFEIERRVRSGDRAARKVFALMTSGLGAALANIIAVISPDAICIGGGLSRFRGYIEGARSVLRGHLRYLPVTAPPILRIRNPEAANIRGAALLTLKRHHF